MENFLSLGLPQQLLNSLEHLKFTTPTPIQAQVIPKALEGKDILGSAQTGTGKTAAFGIPILTGIIKNPHHAALVLTPTRELASQVMKMIQALIGGRPGREDGIQTALLIGGEPVFKQLRQLRCRPQIIVGTPGRINDHLLRKTLKLDNVRYLVLDEADRMLDMGFMPQIEAIVEKTPKERQTLLFSATLPRNILKLSENYLSDPFRVSIETNTIQTEKLEQEVVHLKEGEKYMHLTTQLEKREGSIIVFVKTKIEADRMARRLRDENHSADAIHGDLSHNRRERTIRNFRDSKYRIMIATDIASRGLDIAHVKHVINYDLPQCPEDYIHRIGRTARAGSSGSALCFVTPSDRRKWSAINRLLGNEEEAPRSERRASSSPFPSRNQGGFKRSSYGGGQRSYGSSQGSYGNRQSGGQGGYGGGQGDQRRRPAGPSSGSRFKSGAQTYRQYAS